MAGKQWVVAPESSADRKIGRDAAAWVDGTFKIDVGVRFEDGCVGPMEEDCKLSGTNFVDGEQRDRDLIEEVCFSRGSWELWDIEAVFGHRGHDIVVCYLGKDSIYRVDGLIGRSPVVGWEAVGCGAGVQG